MPWLQIAFDCDREHLEAAEGALEAAGALSVTLADAADEPVLEPAPGAMPLWRATRVTALFDTDADLDALQARLLAALGVDRLPRLALETLEDRAWEREWMARFRPMRFGERLWICPSWSEPPAADAVNIRLDPGLAFGTGTHPTTALCLEWLDAHPPADRTVIDYGCGSGILSLAAARLGAARVVATDIDPQALAATRSNAEHNGIGPDVLETGLPEALPALQADLVLANILSGPLVELEPVLARHTRPGGRIVLSGILAEQAERVVAAYGDDFELDPLAREEDWVRISGRRRPAP